MRDQLVPTCDIMGVGIAAVDLPYVVAYVEERIESLRGNYICVSNVHTTVMSFEDEGYRAVQNNAAMCMPDGGPLSAVGRRRGYHSMDRATGPDLMTVLLARAANNELKLYFYGSSEETLSLLGKAVSKNYPEAKVAGMFSPPFRAVSEVEDEEHVRAINDSGADIVWVGLGAPKQEQWMAAHEGKVDALMIGVGAGFDYLAGTIDRAPAWMQRHSLEWFYRLLQDPVRLFPRYLDTNGKFLLRAVVLGQ